ncbi:hypothetical protein ACFPES_03855 [Paenibacillus sp. GCM10023248]|uniref:hypothetical protein n=1 Tax=unclassified Paenibacillus TaxID=185978 RepID=UPI002379824F|nr:hypothetical protein [Paenibacillus sp. MAHUQ-63]MDD9266162.1 hypothetical protein [Paenibacillus sp. MAHUQ-63]
MNKKLISIMSIGAIITGIVALTPVFAESNVNPERVSKVVTVPAEQQQKKEVVDRLKKSWAKGIAKIEQSKGQTFKKEEWDLIYGVDVDFHFTNNLSATEAQSFFMALDLAKKEYKAGDSQYGILLNKDHKSARIIWERANGGFHIADISIKTETRTLENDPNVSKNPVWSLTSQEELQ